MTDIKAQRLITLRETLGISQEEFGKKIGISRFSISNYESGKRNLTDRVVNDICRTYKVNHIWLTEGIGEMFLDLPETLLDELKIEYSLDDLDIEIIREFINMDASEREVLKAFIRNINSNKKIDPNKSGR